LRAAVGAGHAYQRAQLARRIVMFRLLLPLGGLGLLVVLLARTDLTMLLAELARVGVSGFLAVVIIHVWSFLLDVVLWQLAFASPAARLANWKHFYLIRLIGEAYNNALPLASVGGEPIKSRLLKDYLGIDYTDSGVAFMVAKTANLIALVVFLAVGFGLLLIDPRFDAPWRTMAGLGLAFFTVAIVLLWAVQQARLAPLIQRLLAHRAAHPRAVALIDTLQRMDAQLATCYRRTPRRFLAIVSLAFLTWVAGIFEIWVILYAVDAPIGLGDAWVIEASVQLVRTAAFFIPSGLGVVDGSFVLVVGVISGSGTLGLLVAVVRRARDLLWIAAGFLGGLRYAGGRRLSDGAPPGRE
jgi:hypothetical protein